MGWDTYPAETNPNIPPLLLKRDRVPLRHCSGVQFRTEQEHDSSLRPFFITSACVYRLTLPGLHFQFKFPGAGPLYLNSQNCNAGNL